MILAAKAAREAARNSSPNASPEALREAARQAAREAATGLTRDPSPPPGESAPDPEAAPAETADPETPVVDGAEAAERAARLRPSRQTRPSPQPNPRPNPWRKRPIRPRRRRPRPAPRSASFRWKSRSRLRLPGTAGSSQRHLEELAEQILQELKSRNEAAADFSVTKLMAGITMVVSLAVLACAYLYKGDQPTLQSFLLLGLMLQALTISLLIIGRQR